MRLACQTAVGYHTRNEHLAAPAVLIEHADMIHPDDIALNRARLQHLPVAAAGDAALRLFCTPVLSERRAANHAKLAERARFHLRHATRFRLTTPVGDVQAYRFEPDRPTLVGSVLVVHGWTSEAAFMTALAEPIRRSGFRVLLFDLPAHGLSPGRRTNLVDGAHAIASAIEQMGPIYAVVGHSVGGMMAALAIEGGVPMRRPLPVPHAVLIACPNRLADSTRDFANWWGMSDAGLAAFERRLERIGHRAVGQYQTAAFLRASGARALVVHDRADREVPFSCAEQIVANNPTARLAVFDGFGHRNILFAPPVVRTIVKHLISLRSAVAGA